MNHERIVETYANTVYKVALSQVKNPDDASDIFQEVFLKFVKHKKVFESDEHIKAWLIRVTINQCHDFHRNYYQANKRELVEEIVFHDKKNEDLYHELEALDPKYREVLHLYYYEQLSIKEVAMILEEKEGTIKTRLVRGRNALKTRLEEQYEEEQI